MSFTTGERIVKKLERNDEPNKPLARDPIPKGGTRRLVSTRPNLFSGADFRLQVGQKGSYARADFTKVAILTDRSGTRTVFESYCGAGPQCDPWSYESGAHVGSSLTFLDQFVVVRPGLAPLRLEDFERCFKETGYWIFALQCAQDEHRRKVFGRKMDTSLGREVIDKEIPGGHRNAAAVLPYK